MLGRQQEKLEAEVARLDGQEQRLAVIVNRVQSSQAAPAATPLDELCSAYDGLLRAAPEEYTLYGISAAALAQVGGAPATSCQLYYACMLQTCRPALDWCRVLNCGHGVNCGWQLVVQLLLTARHVHKAGQQSSDCPYVHRTQGQAHPPELHVHLTCKTGQHCLSGMNASENNVVQTSLCLACAAAGHLHRWCNSIAPKNALWASTLHSLCLQQCRGHPTRPAVAAVLSDSPV